MFAPAKSLGLGFYGRSFQLYDTSCSTPGNGFKNAVAAGACITNLGTLAYFEIMDVISSQKPNMIHDNDAGVTYFVYGDSKDQWVSYDDAKTFQPNSLGLGGVMIWSVDQDDNDFSALLGLVGKSLPSSANHLKKSVVTDTGNWASQNGHRCMMSKCIEESDNPNGFAPALNGGPIPDNCGKGLSKWVY